MDGVIDRVLMVWFGGYVMSVIIGVIKAVVRLMVSCDVCILRMVVMVREGNMLNMVVFVRITPTIMSGEVNRILVAVVVSVRVMTLLILVACLDLQRMISVVAVVISVMRLVMSLVVIIVSVRIVMTSVTNLACQMIKALSVNAMA